MMAVGPFQANCYILGCKKTMEGLSLTLGVRHFAL